MKKIFLLLISFFIFLPIIGNAEVVVSDEEELIDAISSGGVITLKNDIEITSSIVVEKEVVINGDNNIFTYSGTMFNIGEDGSLTLNKVVIDGGAEWSWTSEDDRFDPYKTSSNYLKIDGVILENSVFIVNGNLILNSSVVRNFFSTTSDSNFIMDVTNGKVILDDATISNCYGTISRFTSSTLELNNNTQIINNYGVGNKGGIFQLYNSKAYINDANISDNLGCSRSGTLFGIVNESILTMNGGTIRNNISKYYGSSSTGSMLTVETGGGFVMNGGIVTNNLGGLASFIASRWTNTYSNSDGGIYLNRGTIEGNTTYLTRWYEATIYLRSGAVIGDEMIVSGIVVVNNLSASLENNGVIVGEVYVDDTTSSVVNNGIIDGNVTFSKGSFVNNGMIKNAYEVNMQIINNGTILEEYVKTLTSDSSYVVTYNANGGKDIENGYTSFDILVNAGYVVDDLILVVSKVGHTFEGWYIDEELTIEYDFSRELSSNLVLYAKYTPNKYKANWVVDGVVTIEEVSYGSVIVLPTEPIKDGYSFTGWDKYEEGMTMGLDELTFTAVFEKIENPSTGLFNPYLTILIMILISVIAFFKYRRKKFI